MATFMDRLLQGLVIGFVGYQTQSPGSKKAINNFTADVLAALTAPTPLRALPPPRPFEASVPAPSVPYSTPPPRTDIPLVFPELHEPFKEILSPVTNPPIVLDDDPDRKWRDVLPHPSVVLIVGKRGSGKSALAYRLLELKKLSARPYAVGVPTGARKNLPDWIGIVSSLEELPHGAVAVVDEAYMQFHSRESMGEQGRAVSGYVNLSRQRDQTLIFVSQEARQIDRNIASSANVIVFKEPGMLQAQFERPEFRHLADQAKGQLATVSGDVRRWAYVYSPDTDFLGLLENEMPSFWKSSLSKAFAAGGPPAQDRSAEKMTTAARKEVAWRLRGQGRSYNQIARELGVSKATAINYLKGYPGH